MGLFDFIKNEFIEVIHWEDDHTEMMVHKFPIEGKQQIKYGAQLVVRPSQVAVFVYEGQIADVFQPGKYTLETETMPVMTSLKNWKYAFESPFKTDIYFVNTKQYLNQKWGTSKPIMMRDQDFGILRIRGFGVYSFKVQDPIKFLEEVFGTNSYFTVESVNGHLKSLIVSGFADTIAESKIPAIDLAMNYDELGELLRHSLGERFREFGLALSNFNIENISLPDSVEQAIDKRSQMGAVGDLDRYAKFNAAEAIRDAAQNEGGGFASMGAGIGVGANIGKMMSDALTPSEPESKPQAATKPCPNCQNPVGLDAKFCPNCGHSLKAKCVECGAEIKAGAKFCSECGASQLKEKTCSNCGTKMKADAKFCPECGTKN